MKTTASRSFRVVVATAMLAMAVSGCRGGVSQKAPVHLNPNMDNQAFLQGQEPSSFFEDGRGMRLPVADTIAIGELREDAAFHQGKVDGQYLTELPEGMELNAELLARGQERYNIFCAPCHGELGDGHGAVPARASESGTKWIIPNYHDDTRQAYPVGRVFDVASEGFGTMRGYRAQVSTNDLWAISAWVKALQLTQVDGSVDGQ